MDMSMGGMSMDHPGMGSDINYAFSRDYWYLIAGVVGLLAVIRAVNAYGAHIRISSCRDPATQHPTRPDGFLSQTWATATAVVREMSHPQLYVPIKTLRWATPPSLGRILTLLCYWAMIVYFMSWRVVRHDATYWERIGFRNAWVSVCQLPMLYLLAMKYNPIGFLIGSSHERLNWLHRWVARTMFVTVTCHGFHFWTEWVRADFVQYELEIMPMVKYGLGAWAVLLWSVVVGFVPIRRMAYELWLLQHIASAVVMLWLIYKHIPANARHFLWMAIAFLAFDRAARWINLLWQNIQLKRSKSACEGRSRIGHRVVARAVGDTTTVLTIKDVHFKWSAGQHIYLWIPRIGPLEAHPYTIACAHKLEGTCCCNSIQLIVRTHGGFSKRINKYAVENPDAELTGLVSGPYGAPANWDSFERLVLVGASTGASFVVPILEAVAAKTQQNTCVRRIDLAIVAKTAAETQYYISRAKDAAQMAQTNGIDIHLHLALTGASSSGGKPSSGLLQNQSRDSSESDVVDEKARAVNTDAINTADGGSCSDSDSSSGAAHVVREYSARPDIEALIREPVEEAWGETAVVVCGGKEIVARTRNCVAALSDERAVHKGTGAQGIYLHVEEYTF
ncbi:hypothetical protein PWT90_03598 [Aphanocladium album]|nr:hypothetical protein PWT90_03598 [Aphanocladium album]